MGYTERDLVDAIRRVAGGGPGVVVGIGDDAAVLEAGAGQLVLTTDVLVEGVHFTTEAMSARDLGHKAVVVNVSDIAAMAASPRYAVVALTLAAGTPESWVVELAGGMRGACEEYALTLVGGDLSRGGETAVAVTIAGEVAPGRAVLRSGAGPGDRVVVTGALGGAAGGLLVTRNGGWALTDWGRELLVAHQRPIARVGEAGVLASAGATSMIDVSDGTAIDLSRICMASGVGARVDLEGVPIAPALESLASAAAVEPLDLALSGGEDYELLATMPAGAIDVAAATLAERFGCVLTDIGEITADLALLGVDAEGRESSLAAEGWDHFG